MDFRIDVLVVSEFTIHLCCFPSSWFFLAAYHLLRGKLLIALAEHDPVFIAHQMTQRGIVLLSDSLWPQVTKIDSD
jgi:hypothetical protein